MAGWKGHIAGGLVAGAIVATVAPLAPIEELSQVALSLEQWQSLWGVFVLSMLFALFPDVDTNSKAQDIFFAIAFVVDILLIYNGNMEAAAYLGLIAMLPILGHHRGWTHRRWAMLLIPLPILLIPYLEDPHNLAIAALYYAAALAGYFSHLLLDGEIIRSFRVKG